MGGGYLNVKKVLLNKWRGGPFYILVKGFKHILNICGLLLNLLINSYIFGVHHINII